MKDSKPTQNERIMRYMRDFGSITSADAMRDLGVMRLASRVSDLKSRGVRISDTWETARNRYGEPVSYKRYRLEEEPKMKGAAKPNQEWVGFPKPTYREEGGRR